MLSLNKELQEVSGKFVRNMQREFGLQSLSGKLQSWHDLSYADFLRELAKAKVGELDACLLQVTCSPQGSSCHYEHHLHTNCVTGWVG